jgi:hypothetical protein
MDIFSPLTSLHYKLRWKDYDVIVHVDGCRLQQCVKAGQGRVIIKLQ